ncbi:hypothetical protein D9M68_916310 [compost metagenome]
MALAVRVQAIQRALGLALLDLHAAHPEAAAAVALAVVQAVLRLVGFRIDDELGRLAAGRVIEMDADVRCQHEAARLAQGNGADQQFFGQALRRVPAGGGVVGLQRGTAHVDPPQAAAAIAP